MNFRADINALRALAVTLVVLFHFHVPGFGGGFMGVDIFFVISGYLMTKIVVSGLERGNFSYLNFLVARVVRIWPALVVLGLVLMALGALLLPPMDYEALASQTKAALLFDSNRFFRDSITGYFTSGPDERWLLHTWSLSVEWQFYMLYPLLLWAAWRVLSMAWVARLGLSRRKWLFVLVVVVVAVSLVTAVWQTRTNLNSAFFSLRPRIWEMAAGGLVFLIEPAAMRLPNTASAAMRLFALAMLVGALVAASQWGWEWRWPGALALWPVGAAALFLLAGSPKMPVPVWLNLRVIQNLGLWSYSIYLWHWPLVVLINHIEPPTEWAWAYSVAGLSFSLIGGYLSFRFVEARFKFKPQMAWRQMAFGMPLAAAAVVFGGASLAARTAGWIQRAGPDASFYQARTKLIARRSAYPTACQNFKRTKDQLKVCVLNPNASGARILVYGDSHAEHLWPWFAHNAKQRVDFFTAGACPPALGYNSAPPKGDHCDDLSIAIARYAEQPEYKTIIAAGNMEWFDRSPLKTCLAKNGACVEHNRVATRSELVEVNRAFWDHLLGKGKNVVLVRQIPFAPYDLPKDAMRRRFYGQTPHDTYIEKRPAGAGEARYLDDVIAALGPQVNLHQVLLRKQFCQGSVCKTTDPRNGLPIFFDNNHFTADWIAAHGDDFRPFLRKD